MNEPLPESAGKLAAAAVPTATSDQTAAEIIAQTQSFSTEYDTIDYVYVLEGRCLVGVVSLHELFTAPGNASVRTLMVDDPAYVHEHTDQETAAHLALAQNIKAVPVVDHNGEFIGAIPADTILRTLRDEQTEDILRSAGVSYQASERLAQYTLWQHYVSRMPWLIVGLGGGLLAAGVVELFGDTLESELALAAFIPAIVYIADAVGSQTQMVYVRSLTVKQTQTLRQVIARELAVASAIGLTLASLIFLLTSLWLADGAVPLILSGAVLSTVYFSVLVGTILPWAFNRLGKDPALATGPLATVVRDVSSLCIYLLIALLVLST